MEKFRLALIRLGDRSCLSGYFDSENKLIFDNIRYKYDAWDPELDIYTCFMEMENWDELITLKAAYVVDLDKLLKDLIKS